MTNPESYFDFYPNGAIRIKGHRIDLEHVVREYNNGMNLNELLERFPTLTHEEVQACLDYYLAHRQQVDNYIKRLDEDFKVYIQEKERDPRVVALRKKLQEARKRLEATPDSFFSKASK